MSQNNKSTGKEGAGLNRQQMTFLEKWRTRFHLRRLRSELKKKREINHTSITMEDAVYIGILFNASDNSHREWVPELANRWRKKGKKVQILGFYNDKDERETSSSFKFYSRKNLSWTMIPKGEDVQQFMQQPFDIVINCFDKSTSHTDYIMALSQGTFRVGRNNKNTSPYELMIDEKKNDIMHFFGLVDMYLKIFNPKPKNEQELQTV